MPAPSTKWFSTDAVLYDTIYKPLANKICWVSPNTVTNLCFLLVFPIIYGLHVGWSLGLLVGLMFVRQSLDCMDGAIARECKTTSRLGALLDILEDTFTVLLLGGYMTWRLRSIPFGLVILYALTVYVRQIRDHLISRPFKFSKFEQFIHDNTVVISMLVVAVFHWLLAA